MTELDLRYLAQTGEGPVVSVCTLLGDGPDAPMQVELSDRSSGRLTTLVYARTAGSHLAERLTGRLRGRWHRVCSRPRQSPTG